MTLKVFSKLNYSKISMGGEEQLPEFDVFEKGEWSGALG